MSIADLLVRAVWEDMHKMLWVKFMKNIADLLVRAVWEDMHMMLSLKMKLRLKQQAEEVIAS